MRYTQTIQKENSSTNFDDDDKIGHHKRAISEPKFNKNKKFIS